MTHARGRRGWPGGRIEIFLSPTAFLSISVAAAEVFPKETIGLLIGLRSEMRVWVEYAVPMQTVERDEEGVEWKWKIRDRIEEFVTASTSLEVLGQFLLRSGPAGGSGLLRDTHDIR